MALIISTDPELSLEPGNFGIRPKEGELLVPEELLPILKYWKISTAEDLLDVVYNDKIQERLFQGFERRYSWTISDFFAAASKLSLVLDGFLPDRVLYPYGRPVVRERTPPKRRKTKD